MKKINAKDRLKKYALGGEPDPTTPVIPTDANQLAYYSDLLNRSILAGVNPVTHESGKALAASKLYGLLDSVHLFNNRPGVSKLIGEDRINAYYDWNTGNPEVESYKKSFKTINYSPAIDSRTTPNVNVLGKKSKLNDLTKMANGTGVEGVKGAEGLGVWGSLAQSIPQLLNAGIDIFENNPNAYSRQPTLNINSMKSMVTPYGNMAYGGIAGNNIEVEGNEVIETPDGLVSKVKGPSHANGGVDLNVPDATKIFSDRLMLDGKTMAERKIQRERGLKRLEKLVEKSPTDSILRQSFKRTKLNADAQEQKDMQIQKVAGSIYEPETFAYGGISRNNPPRSPYSTNVFDLLHSINLSNGVVQDNSNYAWDGTVTSANKVPGMTDVATPNPKSVQKPNTMGGLTVGDWIGLSGNAFNAIAPLMNTLKNAEGAPPNINRFEGFGNDALNANQSVMDILSRNKTNDLSDISTSANSAFLRNRNSAQGVNTLRALDIATQVGKEKAVADANDNFSKQMMGLFGQRAQLENIQDNVVMGGRTAKDTEDKADRDNFYSNIAQNLTNMGTNVQGIGRALNVSHQNKVDANLISQLSQYGLTFDEDGNLVKK